jgi:hypothetical protein
MGAHVAGHASASARYFVQKDRLMAWLASGRRRKPQRRLVGGLFERAIERQERAAHCLRLQCPLVRRPRQCRRSRNPAPFEQHRFGVTNGHEYAYRGVICQRRRTKA